MIVLYEFSVVDKWLRGVCCLEVVGFFFISLVNLLTCVLLTLTKKSFVIKESIH
jgi:hypothetical protein